MSSAHAARHRPSPTQRQVTPEGVEGNARLTSSLGMLLLILLAVEGFTILSVRQMISLHIIVGLLLIGPVVAKCLTTGYRFVQYYRGVPTYRRKGPPHPVLRVLGPLVIVTSLAVIGTGVVLIYDQHGLWLTAHKASFVLWFAVMTVHVLGHIVDSTREAAAEFRRPALRGRAVRMLMVGVAIVAGVGVTLAVYPSASSWTSHRLDNHIEGH